MSCFKCGSINNVESMIICNYCNKTVGSCCTDHVTGEHKRTSENDNITQQGVCKQCETEPKRLSQFGSNTKSLLNLMDYLQSAYEWDGKKPDCKHKAILVETKQNSPSVYALWKMRKLIGAEKIEKDLLFSPNFFK